MAVEICATMEIFTMDPIELHTEVFPVSRQVAQTSSALPQAIGEAGAASDSEPCVSNVSIDDGEPGTPSLERL